MPIHCVRCDSIRQDSTTPCSCGCPAWSTLPRVEVERLIEDNIGIVRWVVGKWIAPALMPSVFHRIGLEEITAAGDELLLYLARRYDASRGAKFSTFAARYIRQKLWKFVNGEIKRHNREQFYPQYDDDQNPFDPVDKRPDLLIEVDVKDEVETVLPGLMEVLLPREKIAVEMVKARGFRLREVGEVLGVTRERARQLAVAGIERMRQAAIVEPAP